eukprot:1405221-Alexandrium_andersonii.AAC.1
MPMRCRVSAISARLSTSPRRRAARPAKVRRAATASWCGRPHVLHIRGWYEIPCAAKAGSAR